MDDDGDDPILLLSAPPPPTSRAARLSASRGGASSVRGIVNGKGMWKSWTRSFDTPMLALLDLFDNAVDASLTLLEGNQEFASAASAHPQTKPCIQVQADDLRGNKNGIFIRNSCAHPIPPLKQVLEIYKSSKENSSIGENGIGIKHACASLSQLSFVFTKTVHNYGMGLLMEILQKEEGPVLPSKEFNISDDLEKSIRKLAKEQPKTWGLAIEEYGFVEGRGEYALEYGIQNCLAHFDAMTKASTWKKCDNVFTVVLTKLRHAAHQQKPEVIVLQDSDDEDFFDADLDDVIGDNEHEDRRDEIILKELRENLPLYYLHLHAVEVNVAGHIVDTCHWEKRLVEMSHFDVAMDKTRSWSTNGPDWYLDPIQTGGRNTDNVIRFFAGFDPYRCKGQPDEESSNSTKARKCKARSPKKPQGPPMANSPSLRVYTYSRASGRLIKVQTDPRGDLGLVSASSDYKQGLTLIIDDYNGTLPLNPTKQDTAFGHSEHGAVHAENIKHWTAAIIRFFWTYHYKQAGESKFGLAETVYGSLKDVEDAYRGDYPRVVPLPLSLGTFIRFSNIKFDFVKSNGYREKFQFFFRKTSMGEIKLVSPADDEGGISPNQVIRLNKQAGENKVAERDALLADKKRKARDTAGESSSGDTKKKKAAKIDDQKSKSKMKSVEKERDEFKAENAELKKEIQKLPALKKKIQKLREENARLVQTQRASKRAEDDAVSRGSTGEDDLEMAKVQKKQLRFYKSQSAFHEKEVAYYKRQLREVQEEKRRFEERVVELEKLQLESLSEEV